VFTGINGDEGVRNGYGDRPRTWGLTVTRETVGEVLVVAVSGRLGTGASGTLVETIVGALERGHRRVLVDLEGVDYASSAGLLALHAIAGRISVDGGALVLCSLTEPVRLVFELSGLSSQFAIASDRAAGLAQLAGGGLQTSSADTDS